MRVSRSGFYAYIQRSHRAPTERQQEIETLVSAIKAIHEESKKRYGSPRIHIELKKRGHICSLLRVKRLMRQEGIYALPERKYKRRKMPETLLETANLLAPKPTIVKANQVWYSDITFVKTAEGWELGPKGRALPVRALPRRCDGRLFQAYRRLRYER